jgi:octanoyl-[GcvH]:protein N-octanoyltransferase
MADRAARGLHAHGGVAATRSRRIRLVRDSFPGRPAFDTAVSRAILERVALGALPETVRVARPGAMVAFGRRDVTATGYAAAVHAAREGGFEAVERLAGGRAAVFHQQTVALAWAIAGRDAIAGTHDRFGELAAVVATTLDTLGVDARLGEVPGEYCPGEYSISARGERKLVGIGQRVIRGGAHLGGVVVVREGERIRDVLVPVYEALALAWDPGTVGSIADELPDIEWDDAAGAIVAELGARYEIEPADLDAETLALAEALEPEHRSPD